MITVRKCVVGRSVVLRALLVLAWAGAFLPSSGGANAGQVTQPAAVNSGVFATGLGSIADTYIDPVDLSQLTLAGLNGLTALDPAISAAMDERTVRLLRAGQTAATFPRPATQDAGEWAALISQVLDRLRPVSDSIASADPESLYQAVFDAVTSRLDDFSRYSGARKAEAERALRDGYGDVGISLGFVARKATVRGLSPRGEAYRAGLRVGDVITHINGAATASMPPTVLRQRLRGPIGSEVRLTAVRKTTTFPVAVHREWRVPNTVRSSFIDGVALLQVERFSAATASHLRAAVASLRRPGAKKLIGAVLDLRGNPGGLLDQAVDVADLFLSGGRIATTEGRHPESWQTWDAKPEDVIGGLPLVVLVDNRSASSAEVVAAALQEQGRAVVVGATSFGKGSVQTVTRLPNDGELFLTWSRYFTPSGQTLHRQGVVPSVCTSGEGGPDEALADLIQRGSQTGVRRIAATRPASPQAPRMACIWREHPAEYDVTVARRLIADPSLYALARTPRTSTALAQR